MVAQQSPACLVHTFIHTYEFKGIQRKTRTDEQEAEGSHPTKSHNPLPGTDLSQFQT